MSSDLSSIESDLRQLRPATLDDALLARLDACAGNSWTELEPGEIRFAQQLGKVAPAQLPPALLAALEATMSSVPFPGEDNIVRFPNSTGSTTRHPRVWWGAAAAVALLGAGSALFVPTRHATGQLAATPPAHSMAMPARHSDQLTPAGFNRGLTEAHDEGVIWPSNEPARRVLKVVYMDRVTLKDAAGRTYQLDQPRVEYILVPAKAD
jgi:hypothetical protein